MYLSSLPREFVQTFPISATLLTIFFLSGCDLGSEEVCQLDSEVWLNQGEFHESSFQVRCRKTVECRLALDEIPEFGGYSFDAGFLEGDLTIYITDSDPEKAEASRQFLARYYPTLPEFRATEYTVEDGEFSYLDLAHWKEQSMFLSNYIPGLYEVTASRETNRVLFGLAPETNQSCAEDQIFEAASVLDIPVKAIDIQFVEPVVKLAE